MNAPLVAFRTSTDEWRPVRYNRSTIPSTVGSDFPHDAGPLRFVGAATQHRIVPMPAGRTFEEKIFDSLVSLKVAVSAYAMHLSADERSRLFAELDDKINVDDWHEEDKLPAVNSFLQFLKWMIYAHHHKWTSIGISAAGTIMVAWRTSRVLLTADFVRENEVRWTAQLAGENGEVGHTAGRCGLRLFSEQALFYLER
jgi:hypothetical protein